MWTISTLDWALSVFNLIQELQLWFLSPFNGIDPTSYVTVVAAFSLVNYFLTDGVVVWRAWVLCSDQSSKALRVPIVFLCCLALTVTTTIVIRLILASPAGNDVKLNAILTRAIDASQVANLIISLLTNVSATSIVSFKAWKYRQAIKVDLKTVQGTPKGSKVLVLLVESGVLYVFSGITVLIATVIRLPHGTAGDIYTPVNFQIAGIYPIVVLLLVNQQSSMNKTAFASTIPRSSRSGGLHARVEEKHLETMQFHARTIDAQASSISGDYDEYNDYIPDAYGKGKGQDGHDRFSIQSKALPQLPEPLLPNVQDR
jgi:hypothetical protein